MGHRDHDFPHKSKGAGPRGVRLCYSNAKGQRGRCPFKKNYPISLGYQVQHNYMPNVLGWMVTGVLVLFGFIFVGGALGAAAWWAWKVLMPPVGTTHSVSGVHDETTAELTEINQFICEKDENDLRAEFDFPAMLTYNIEFAKRDLAPQLISKDESAAIDTFFLNGQARIDLRYARVRSINNRATVEWIPGKIGVVNTSKKYVESRKRLTRLMSSAAVPAEVSAALKLFDDAIEKDSALMIVSLNQSLKADPRSILEDGVYGSNWYGSARGLYWKEFIPLRPRADVVAAAVRKAMNK